MLDTERPVGLVAAAQKKRHSKPRSEFARAFTHGPL